ncbi:MAG: lysophospholipid acyltransferase family protein [Planctomycetes bacterium]|nr:lysophospholipid acyltransferase family protein [Planctomycetota bacterium]
MSTDGAPEQSPLPRRWPWLVRGFRGYAVRYVRKHFHAVRLSKSGGTFPATDEPLLVVLNHPSWWDPLIGVVLSREIAGRDHFAAIDAVAVRRYRFFTKLGFVGVDTKSLRGAADFLRAGRVVLSQPRRAFWVTAQGRFTDVRERPLALRSGVGHLAARLGAGVVLPVALEYTFWTESTPEALVRIGEPLRIADHPGLRGKEWTARIEAALTRNLDALNAEAMRRDPGAFAELLSGRSGVGGVYDVWRRLKAWVRGRKFDPSHDAATHGAES